MSANIGVAVGTTAPISAIVPCFFRIIIQITQKFFNYL